MPKCQWVENCPFFNEKMKDMPATAESTKKRLCLSAPDQCARYLVRTKLGKEKVPADLFPNEMGRARDLVREMFH